MFAPENLFLSLLFLLLLPPPLPAAAAAADRPLYQLNCGGTGNYTANSTYLSNLGLLLSSLTANASGRGAGFSAGAAGQPPHQVSGLALCRGGDDDVDSFSSSSSSCSSCLGAGAADILDRCPHDKDAVIWYDDCLIRYSSQHFLSPTNNSKPATFVNADNVAGNLHLFNKMATWLANTTAARAAYNATRRFATTSTANSMAEVPLIYGSVHCTPDMTVVEECWQCLQGLIDEMPSYFNGSKVGHIVGVSCSIKYELAAFSYEVHTLRLTLLEASTVPAPMPAPVEYPQAVVPAKEEGKNKNVTGIVLPIVIPLAIIFAINIRSWWKKRSAAKQPPLLYETTAEDKITSVESLFVDLSTLRAATANFDEVNKLGEGGFGAVYKGILPDGREIAVKRLSRSSLQGIGELKNELVLVAKLQHRNLVKLLGVCLEEEEKILVYEYVPNRSLDTIIFDSEKKVQLNWGKRHSIINGIARALLYLHEDSQLKIIHRDLKANNILLDKDMNPKISDFGLARLFEEDQTRAITNRVVGTFGYIAPEYAMHGHFSIKSDVFSFGIVILEIITGRKSTATLEPELAKSLITYIWEHWINGTILEIVDPSLGRNYSENEDLRCVHIGLLCVQENPADRPKMSTVVVMLSRATVSLQTPCRPAFCAGFSGIINRGIAAQPSNIPMSQNEVSITEIEPR